MIDSNQHFQLTTNGLPILCLSLPNKFNSLRCISRSLMFCFLRRFKSFPAWINKNTFIVSIIAQAVKTLRSSS